MALKRIVGTAVRLPFTSTAKAAGVAKGTLGVARRLVHGENPFDSSEEQPQARAAEEAAPEETSSAPEVAAETSVPEPEVVPLEPENRDLPEPVVIYAEDDEPEPTPEPEHVEVEEELVYTSESEPSDQPQG